MEFFAHARSALKFGLEIQRFNKEKFILIPAFICEAVMQPFRELGLKVKFYEINENFQPRWDDLQKLCNDYPCQAILMNHYFGIPQKIDEFMDFAHFNNLFIIEDNAHGFGASYRSRLLGTFGDIGILSPRKTLFLPSGAILYQNSKIVEPKNLPQYRTFLGEVIIRRVVKNNPKIKISLNYLRNSIDFDNPAHSNEKNITSMKADTYSSSIIEGNLKKENLSIVQRLQMKKWDLCMKEILSLGLKPAISSISEGASPWLFPVRIENQCDRNKLFKLNKKKNFVIITWPNLPPELICQQHPCINIWKGLSFVDLTYRLQK